MFAFRGNCAVFPALTAILWAGPAGCQPFLYVANQNASTVSVIDTRTGAVAASPATGFSPAGLALSPDGSRLFAANPNGNSIFVFNTTSNTLAANLAIGQHPMSVAVDSSRLYIALHANAGLAVYSAATLAQQAVLRVGFGPCAVGISGATNRVYVANTYSNTVSVVDPSRIGGLLNPVVRTIDVPASPVALAVSPDGLTAWVASSAIPTLTRIHLEEGTVAPGIPLPFPPAGLAIAPDNAKVYVTGYGPRVVGVDVASGQPGAVVTLAGCDQPRCLAMGAAVSADGRTVYVANTSRNQIAVLNTERNEVTATIGVQASPRAVVLGPAPRPTTPSTVPVKTDEEDE